ncbi:S41 family peptidase [Actinoplanes sp. NPDC051861]|uniref:S41 family peptidase n=1 Tax=Actinoplanes sp. NPDC051861 TaxID=3155170 RepID=UPI003430CB5C
MSTAVAIAEWVERLLPDRERAARLAAALRDEFGAGDEADSPERCRRIERVCHRFARHLTLEYFERAFPVPDKEKPTGWPPPDGLAIRAARANVAPVEHVGDAALLRLDSLESWEFAGLFVEEAFAAAKGARRLVLDLRHNGGGAMDTLARIAGFVLGREGELLATVTALTGVEECRTPVGAAWGGETVVLTSRRTYSSGEALAYVLRNRGVRVIGERTPGAADHCVPVRVTRHVVALIPFAVVQDPVTGGNWEGTGVVPDVEVPEERALEIALG